jgi:hypothetical protein
MAPAANATLIISRILADAYRLASWARVNGTDKQRAVAADLIKAIEHITPMYTQESNNAEPKLS